MFRSVAIPLCRKPCIKKLPAVFAAIKYATRSMTGRFGSSECQYSTSDKHFLYAYLMELDEKWII